MAGILKNVFRSASTQEKNQSDPKASGDETTGKDEKTGTSDEANEKAELRASAEAPKETNDEASGKPAKPRAKRGGKPVVVLRGDDGEETKGLLESLDQEQVLDDNDYRDKMRAYQTELLCLQRAMSEEKERGLIVVLEGPDAAGKGGVIKRVSEKLDPRTIRVYSIIKPTAEEYAHHYMWRFWTKIPPYGHFAIFDRSWYGRVLVERVESFAKPEQWKRAYQEINEFERQLTDDGAVLVKLYLQITKEEQLTRFKRRSADPLKHWKISEEDWRNRRNWDEHIKAAEDMFAKTSTKNAPWHIIPTDSKWFARIQTLRLIIKALEKAGVKA
jgi:PPK2 family polyphosphate:nucleotide phosphotransferase